MIAYLDITRRSMLRRLRQLLCVHPVVFDGPGQWECRELRDRLTVSAECASCGQTVYCATEGCVPTDEGRESLFASMRMAVHGFFDNQRRQWWRVAR